MQASPVSRGEACEPEIYMEKRKNIRLKKYDYGSKGKYFITICVKGMRYIFGELVDNKMILNNNGNIAKNIILNFQNKNYGIDYYQIMPNHLHCIIDIKENGKYKLSHIVSRLKSKIANLTKISGMWQKGYYDRVIRNQKEYDNIVKYIINNPFRDKYNW